MPPLPVWIRYLLEFYTFDQSARLPAPHDKRDAANLARLYQEGSTGFTRFMEIMEIEPYIQDAPDAIEVARPVGAGAVDHR